MSKNIDPVTEIGPDRDARIARFRRRTQWSIDNSCDSVRKHPVQRVALLLATRGWYRCATPNTIRSIYPNLPRLRHPVTLSTVRLTDERGTTFIKPEQSPGL